MPPTFCYHQLFAVLLGVTALGYTGQLIEIDLTASLP